MKLLSALIVGAAASLFASYYLIVTAPAVRIRKGSSGMTITLKLGNPDGPDLAAVPAPPVEEATPVPIPDAAPSAESDSGSESAAARQPNLLPPAPSPKPSAASMAAGDKPRTAENLAAAENVAGNPSKRPSPKDTAASNRGASQPARATQANDKPVRTKTVYIVKYVPDPTKQKCAEEKGGGGGNSWGDASRRNRR